METFYAVTLSIKRDQLRKKELQNSKVCVKFESVYYTPYYFTSIQHWQNSEISKLCSKISEF